MVAPSIGADYPKERQDRVPIIRDAISATVDLVNRQFPNSVHAHLGASSIASTNCYFLLSNAYKRARLIEDSRTYDYKVAAFTAAAIMTFRPIRFVRQPAADEDLVRFANFDCATRASTSLLNVALDRMDPEFVRRFHRVNLGAIYLPCLSSYLENFDKIIFMNDRKTEVTFDEVESAIPFGPYNNIDLHGRQMIQLEQLVNVYFLLKMSRDALVPAPRELAEDFHVIER